MGKNAHINKLMNPNKKLGDKQYPFGYKILIPALGDADPVQLTFTGSFDRRKLRKMVKKSFVSNLTKEQVDWIIDTFGTPLRTVTKQEFTDMLVAFQEEENKNDGSS